MHAAVIDDELIGRYSTLRFLIGVGDSLIIMFGGGVAGEGAEGDDAAWGGPSGIGGAWGKLTGTTST